MVLDFLIFKTDHPHFTTKMCANTYGRICMHYIEYRYKRRGCKEQTWPKHWGFPPWVLEYEYITIVTLHNVDLVTLQSITLCSHQLRTFWIDWRASDAKYWVMSMHTQSSVYNKVIYMRYFSINHFFHK